MIKGEEIVYKSNNGNKYIVFFFLVLIIYAVGWSLFKAPILLIYTIPFLIIICYTSRSSFVTKNSIYFYYPLRLYNRKKKIPFSYIKKIGKIYGPRSHQFDYAFLIGYYRTKTDNRFKLNDYKEIEYLIKDKKHGNLMFELFEKHGVNNLNESDYFSKN